MLSLALFCACAGASAQEALPGDMGSVDADVTIVGRDETVIPLPAPPVPPDTAFPQLDLTPLDFSPLPPIDPPRGVWTPGSNDGPMAVLRREGLQ